MKEHERFKMLENHMLETFVSYETEIKTAIARAVSAEQMRIAEELYQESKEAWRLHRIYDSDGYYGAWFVMRKHANDLALLSFVGGPI